jgi:hypothetical protein
VLKRLLASIFLLTVASTVNAQAANKTVIHKKPPPPPDYFPLRVNDWWKYQSTTGEGKQSKFDIKVVSAEKQPDETTIYTVDTTTAKVIHDWYSKPKGLVLKHKEQYGDAATMLVNYDPLYQFIKNPLVNNDSWEWKGKGMMGVDIEDSAQVSGPEDIYVPAGKYSTMKVVTKVKQGGSEVTKTYWFANWVGLVKSATQSGPVGSVTELLDYSFKKPPTKN